LPADLIGKHFSVIIHPEDVDSVTRANVLMRLKGCVVGDENSPRLFDERRTGKRLTRKLRARLVPKWGVDGCQGALDVEVVSIGLYHYNGSDTPVFAGTLGLIRDITESQRSQKAIMRVEQHYRLLLENSSDIITILAHDGTVLYKSNSIQRILGFDPVELVGESEYDYIHPDDRDGFKSLLVNECNTGEEPVDCQFRYRNSEGVWRDLKSSVTPIVDLNGKTRCFVINSQMSATGSRWRSL
jgi:PAS domain S-box-containing protein